jgi:integrase
MPVATFGVTEAKALMTYVGERGLTNKTRNKYLQYYRGLFQTLVDEELAIKNPFEKIKKLKQTTEGYVPFNAEQVTELLAYFRQHDRPLYQFVCCIYYGFLRPKEVRLLRVRDVDFRNRIIRVPAEVGKTGQRFVDINQPFAEMLDQEGLVWADSDVPLVPAALGTDRLFSENGAALRHRKLLQKLGYGPEYKLYAH